MARVAGAAVALIVPTFRAGINQRVMAVRAEMRRFRIDAAGIQDRRRARLKIVRMADWVNSSS